VLDIEDGEPGELVACGQCNATLAVPMSVTSAGSMLGDFAIVREIGCGGMGRVYLAHQVSLDRPVALKILSENFVQDTNFIKNFINEARTAASLNHPNIVQAYAVNFDSGCYYFAMELVEGNTMKQVLQNSGRLVHEKVLAIAWDVLGALDYAWREKKLIHRDIKPDNIMLTNDGRTKLADLGLARKITETNEDGSSELYGTPQYVAPELILSCPADIRSDIYSMGATMYHALTGSYPYRAQDANSMAMEHLFTPLQPIQELVSDVPLPLARLVEIMMAKRPGHRYQNYQNLLADLQLVKNGEMPRTLLPAMSQIPVDTDLPIPQSLSIEEADLLAAASAAGAEKSAVNVGKKSGKLVLGGKSSGATLAASGSPSSTGELKLSGKTIHPPSDPAIITQVATPEKTAVESPKRTRLMLLIVAAVILVFGAGLGIWGAMHGSQKGEALTETLPPSGNATAVAGLTGLQAALNKLSSEGEKLAFLKGEAIKLDVGSPEYDAFVNVSAPLLEPALQAARERLKSERKTDWENRQAGYQEDLKQQQEAALAQAEREKKEAAEKAEQTRLEKAAEEKTAAFAKKQQNLRNIMVQQAQELDFSGARKVFAVMVASEEEQERDWAGMWLSSLDDAEQLYQLLRNSKGKLAGVLFRIRDERRIDRDWEVVSILYDTVKIVRVNTEREKNSKNPEPAPEKTFELNDINLNYFMLLAKKVLECENRTDEFDRMFGNYLLTRGYPIAKKWLEAAMVSDRLLSEIPFLRESYVKARLNLLDKMNRREAEREVAILKNNFSEEFAPFIEDVMQKLKDRKD